MKYLQLFIFFLIFDIFQVSLVHAQNISVLGKGSWLKIGVTESGIYKIEASQFQKLGWDIKAIDPNTIKVFGNGGAMLPQSNKVYRPNDLIENAALVVVENDAVLHPADAIYFYAEGPNIIRYDSSNAALYHELNIYTDTSYYFLTYGGNKGLRVQQRELLNPTNELVNSFDDYWYRETEQYNLLHSGREWWGDYIGLTPLKITTGITNIVRQSPIVTRISAIAAAQIVTNLKVSGNSQLLGEGNFPTVLGQTYTQRSQQFKNSFNSNLSNDVAYPFDLTISYDNKGQLSAQAFLDYVSVQTKRVLMGYQQQQFYRFLPDKRDTLTYQVAEIGSGWQLWDISAIHKPTQIINNGNQQVTFTVDKGKKFREFIGFNLQQAKTPGSVQRISNQDISQNLSVEFLIVTPKEFALQANRLADFRQNESGLISTAVTIDQIYNQYASGKQDITAIRDYVRQLYIEGNGNLKYLLLFGDATYDYKNILKNQTVAQRLSWVPVYESRESLQPVYTYSSDDYFGFLGENEGEWIESQAGDHLLDIGIGRLPVKTIQEAEFVVDKLMHYDAPESKGNWRNKIEFVADDGDYEIHQSHAAQLTKIIEANYLTKKIFIDKYPQINLGNGQRAPKINEEIKNAINRGALILNYTGHGGVNGWAQEQVLTLSDMLHVRGNNNLPLLVTATCDFGRYDDMAQVSGAELMVLSPRGAAIGALITTRPVYSSTNFLLNSALYQVIKKKSIGAKRLGDIVKETKNNALAGSLNRNFTLLGDPSMTLIHRKRSIHWNAMPDTLKAYDRAQLSGNVMMATDSTLDTNFNGDAYLTVFEQENIFTTLGDEGDKLTYSEYNSKLFEGKVAVLNGKFKTEFIVPMDIKPEYGIGRISLYAMDSIRNLDVSAQKSITIGGEGKANTAGSEILLKAFMNDISFKSGDVITPNSDLFIQIATKNGVNLLNNELKHNISAVVNDTLSINLNDYFVADIANSKNGSVYYPFENLPKGSYTIALKVWDTYNNFSNCTFDFEVGERKGLHISNRIVYPNPFQNDWVFELEHNYEGDDIEVMVKIMSPSGATLGVEKWQYYNASQKIKEVVKSPSLTTALNGNQLYIYSIEIRSLTNNSKSRGSGKLFKSP